LADRCRCCTTQFRQFGGKRIFAGRIRTVLCDRDNLLVRRALEMKTTGEVLVVDGGGRLTSALLGDNLAALGLRNGWAGIVINGAVRDTPALAEINFGVKALGSNPRKSGKTGAGKRDVIVTFGGVNFVPNEWLLSDDDGIVVAAEAYVTKAPELAADPRPNAPDGSEMLRRDGLSFDRTRGVCGYQNKPIVLGPREIRVMRELMVHAGKAVTDGQLALAYSGDGSTADFANVTSCIQRLRHKIENVAGKRLIRRVDRGGFQID
jgi:regulator of ribonuclease activity A